ncbi:unnamed protein product [Linum trigynum]|uniref:Uncharacterized protein n=1 Tax=Linum trigynum TaxID=586398 RepID=A0AAV2FQD1_9ROSI
MESRGLSAALAMMLVLLLAAGSGQCQPSSLAPADQGNYYRGHKACDPLCFVKCALTAGDINCYGECIQECLVQPAGEPDPDDHQATCMATCAVPACTELSTKAEPFSKDVELCLESCADHCTAKKAEKQQQLNHSP